MKNDQPKEAKQQTFKIAKMWEVLLAGGIGAFIAGFTDLFTNQGSSGVAELSRKIALGGDSISLLLLVALGVGICWVFRPATKLDGFARGLAILTLIGITSKNNMADEGPPTQQLESSIKTQQIDQPLLASIDWMNITYDSDFAPCPKSSGTFNPNATVANNSWISSTKPETKAFSTNIFTTNCDNSLKQGQKIQLVGYYETTFKGYYYVQINYMDVNTLRTGWIYSGRSPNHFQQVKPFNANLNPYGFGR